MADQQDRDTLQPLGEGDIKPPPANADFTPAAPLKDAGVEFTPEGGTAGSTAAGGLKQTLLDKTQEARGQATDKAKLYAEDGKAKATSALGQLSQMLTDAAGQVDEKLGEQYGQYARAAADKVQGYSSALDAKSIDELVEDARALVQKSPAVAIGAAAAIGFVIARVLGSGLDQRDA
jgi:ElaB/YqjD/DUF883 family membrane-anchored ribosome-binding protein